MLRQSRYAVQALLLCLGFALAPALQADSVTNSRAVASRLLANVDQATWIAEGRGNRVIYIFFDPNCPYCHKLYESLRPLIEPHQLQVRWIPVGMLTASSLGKAAAIMQADDPLAAFHEAEESFNFSESGPGGGIQPAEKIDDTTQLNLAANLSLLQGENLFTVPITVFQANDGQGGFMFEGAPPAKTLEKLLKYVR